MSEQAKDRASDREGEEPRLEVEKVREYGHGPPKDSPQGDGRDVAAGHAAAERRGHQSADGSLELGHPPPEGAMLVQVGEMHSPAEEAPPPTAAPVKPEDSAQSVSPPQARQETAPEDAAGGDDQS